MALNCARLLCQRQLNNSHFSRLNNLYSSAIFINASRTVTMQACEDHATKNKRLGRPMSPHLTIYKLQLTSVLSITHRGTGMALAFYAIAAGYTELFYAGGMNCMIESIHGLCLPLPIMFLGKFCIAWPAMFHYFNGIRHLSWDLGMFLTIKEVYSTGWAMLGTSVVAALILSAIC